MKIYLVFLLVTMIHSAYSKKANLQSLSYTKTISDYPFIGVIFNGQSWCTASLVQPILVVTAGQCICTDPLIDNVYFAMEYVGAEESVDVGVNRIFADPGFTLFCRYLREMDNFEEEESPTDIVSGSDLGFARLEEIPFSLDGFRMVNIIGNEQKVDYIAYQNSQRYVNLGLTIDELIFRETAIRPRRCPVKMAFDPICVEVTAYSGYSIGSPIYDQVIDSIIGTYSGLASYADNKYIHLFTSFQSRREFVNFVTNVYPM